MKDRKSKMTKVYIQQAIQDCDLCGNFIHKDGVVVAGKEHSFQFCIDCALVVSGAMQKWQG